MATAGRGTAGRLLACPPPPTMAAAERGTASRPRWMGREERRGEEEEEERSVERISVRKGKRYVRMWLQLWRRG
uniref:Uncharacterized protein n=2 Tax=Oryza sativa subsp. japonica TaxID=39947 RepID=Q2R7J8_ORYSJ|nr:hypothetical protein LOC_Os11g16360 [Oryza sativa Japonica Group]ABA92492.1 hypothetical protein LOC_Os11g16360 [Oryza sativa Japonica Group]